MARRMAKKKKKIIIGVVLILLIAIGGGIFAFNKVVKKDEDGESKETIAPTEEVRKLNIVDETSKSRPYAVMINNINAARPYQSGLQDAYIIYEMIVEGGITRYLALFKDQDTERIGTVRSSRHYYLDYALENDAIYVHWGWSPQAQSDIKSLDIDNVNGLTYSNTYFWKDTSLRSLGVATEHTAYTSMEMLKQATSDLGYRNETDKGLLLNYSVDKIDLSTVENAQVANNVSITYSNSITSSYQYDSEENIYYRSVNGLAHTDYVTKKQYTFRNIIIYQVHNNTISDDAKNRQELDNIGSGTGYYISDGYTIPIEWEKKSRSSKTKYTLENGEELQVNDGNTFIQIQPKGQSLAIS